MPGAATARFLPPTNRRPPPEAEPDRLLAIMVGGTVARWDEALSAAEPLLESVRIGP